MPRATPLPPDERRAAIMAATEPLLEVHGRNVSTRQIAEAAEVAEGTIFRVFPSKEALIDAVVEDAFAAHVTCAELRAIELTGDLDTRLVEAVVLLQERLRRVFALFHSLTLKRHVPSHDDIRSRHQQENALLDSALAELIAPDRDRFSCSPEEAAGLLRTFTFSISHPMLSDRLSSEPKQIVDILLYGITKRHDAQTGNPC